MQRPLFIGLMSMLALSTDLRGLAADEGQELAQAESQSITQLKQIGLAMHNYHDVQKSFPPAAITAEDKPMLSWRVALLPYLGDMSAKKLYSEFHLDEPWDSEHNKPLLARIPAVYRCPRSKLAASGMTVYLAPVGPETIFSGPEGTKMRQVTDGLSNTILIVEASEDRAVPWTKPEEWKFDPTEPSNGLGGHFPNRLLLLLADGSVHVVRDTINKDQLVPLFTRNGREIAVIPDN